LALFEKENTLQKVSGTIATFHQNMLKFRDLSMVGDLRYIGMIAALELVKDKRTKEPFPFEARIGLKVYKKGLEKGLLLRPLGNIIYLFLPLCVTENELIDIIERTYSVLATL
jgi:adenosylmethionine-8-amino-7-oxononanoate aminotransferase